MGMTVMINWLFVAWMIRLAEAQWNYKNGSTDGVSAFLDTLWLVPITFTTIGYGDFYPRSYIGRLWCIWLALLGCVATAILVNIMTDTLGMTRRERLLFRVLNNDNLRNSLKEKAAIVLQRTWRAHKKGKRVLAKPTIVRSNESTDEMVNSLLKWVFLKKNYNQHSDSGWLILTIFHKQGFRRWNKSKLGESRPRVLPSYLWRQNFRRSHKLPKTANQKHVQRGRNDRRCWHGNSTIRSTQRY